MPFPLQVDVGSQPETPAQFQGIGTIAIFVRGLIRAHRATLERTTTRSFSVISINRFAAPLAPQTHPTRLPA
jgi:hypothetical protein